MMFVIEFVRDERVISLRSNRVRDTYSIWG
jgi:hypothetical protein